MRPYQWWTKERIIEEIKKLGPVPTTSKKIEKLYAVASRQFGSWDDALRASGYDPEYVHRQAFLQRKTNKKWTKELVVETIRTMTEGGRSLNVWDVQRLPHGACLTNAARVYCGSWKSAVEMAGYKYDDVLAEGRKRLGQFAVREIKEPIKDTKLAYFVGLLIGDGCIAQSHNGHKSYHVTYTSTDKELSEAFATLGKDIFGLDGATSRKTTENKPLWNVRFCAKRMHQWLWKETGGKRKAPKWIVNGTNEVMSAFIRGFADAEGGVTDTNTTNVVIAQKDRNILVVIQYMLYKLGIFSRVCVANSNGVHGIRISNHPDVVRYMNIVGFNLTRKKDKAAELLSKRKMPPYGEDGIRARKRMADLIAQKQEWGAMGLEVA